MNTARSAPPASLPGPELSSSSLFGSLTEVFTRLSPRLRRVADRGLSPDLMSKVGASDIVQETFCVAHRQRAQLRGKTRGEAGRWLERILLSRLTAARRRFRHAAKRRSSREVRLGAGPADARAGRPVELAAPTTASPLSRVVLAERAEALRAALASLTPADMQVIRWHQEDDLPFGEIGLRLGTSAEAARKRWARAIFRLGAAMDAADASR